MISRNGKQLGLVAVLVAGLTAGAIGLASARGRGGPGGPGDHDARRAELMKQADTNRDGKLDDAERQAMHAARQAEHAARKQQLLAKYDANRDGKLDDAERAAIGNDRAAERFKQLDTDGNGSLSLAEFQAGKPDGKRGRGHHGPGRGGPGGGPGPHGEDDDRAGR